MRKYNIVTNYKIVQILKKSRYFRFGLGLSSTQETNSGDRHLNNKDWFAFYYNNMYRTTIYGQGSVGDIFIYTDHYIKEEKIAFYYDKEEFIFDFDEKIINEKGADFYLGHLIKTIETEHQERLTKKQETIEEQKKEVGDANKIFENPGAVKYADLKAYMEKIRLDRLKS
jgi:hypothetical protein